MPFNHLLPTCYLEGYNHLEDRCKVFFDREKGEKTLFFHIDDQSNKKSPIRQIFNIKNKQGEQICDLFIIYWKENTSKVIFALVELKTNYNDVDKGVIQVLNTLKHIKILFNDDPGFQLWGNVKWAAYVCYYESSSPQDHKKDNSIRQKRLNKEFNDSRVTNENNIGLFFRETY